MIGRHGEFPIYIYYSHVAFCKVSANDILLGTWDNGIIVPSIISGTIRSRGLGYMP